MTRRLLLHADSLCASTGFAGVTRTIVEALPEWQIDQVAINHPGLTVEHDRARIYAAGPPDCGGKLACDLYLDRDYDLMLIVQDLHVAAGWAAGIRRARAQRVLRKRPATPVVFLFPVDGPMLGFADFVDVADLAVTCTRWGRDIVRNLSNARVLVIPHDVDTDAFQEQPPPERADLRRRVYNVDERTVTLASVAVNTVRKDLFQILQALAQLRARGGAPRAKVHFHTVDRRDVMDLRAMAAALDLVQGVDYQIAVPTLLNAPRAVVSDLYAASDGVVFSSRREGWGLPMTEAMACGTAVLAPRFGPFAEILGHDRGYLHEPLGLLWTDREHRGPCWLTDPAALADQIVRLGERRETAEHRALLDRAKDYVQRLATPTIGAWWRHVLCDVVAGRQPLETPTELQT